MRIKPKRYTITFSAYFPPLNGSVSNYTINHNLTGANLNHLVLVNNGSGAFVQYTFKATVSALPVGMQVTRNANLLSSNLDLYYAWGILGGPGTLSVTVIVEETI